MASSPMRVLFRLGPLSLFWARRDGFLYPGLVLWPGRRLSRFFRKSDGHVRLLPIPATKNARAWRRGKVPHA